MDGRNSKDVLGNFMLLCLLIPGFKFNEHIQAFMFDCNKLRSALFLHISVSELSEY